MADNLQQFLSLTGQARARDPNQSSTPPAEPAQPNWSASLSMVHQAAEVMRASAERAQTVEARSQEVLQRASQELRNAQAKIKTIEEQLHASETRAKAAEARAKEAEGWLQRMHDAISEDLSPALSVLHDISDAARG